MRKFLSVFLVVSLIFSVTSFADNSSSEEKAEEVRVMEYPVKVGDTIIEEKPDTIGTISPAMTDILKGLGFEYNITAMGTGSVAPVFPDLKDDYPVYEIGTLMEPNLENLKKALPDVLFVHAPLTELNRKRIEAMGIKVVEVPYAQTFDEIFDNYRMICKVMLGENKGGKYAEGKINRYRDILNLVSEISVKNSKEKTAVYMDMFPKTLATGESFQNIILKEVLAFENLAEESENWILDDEKMKELNPDVIFYNKSINPEEIKAYVSYATTTAITENKLYALKGKYFQSKSPQMFMNLVSLMYKLYPDEMPKDLSEI